MSVWSKNNELDYLKSLIDGTLWRGLSHQPGISRIQIVKNYISSAKKRLEWGTYVKDGEEVIAYAEQALESMK